MTQPFIDFKELISWKYLTVDPYIAFKYQKEVVFFLIAAFLISIPLFILSGKKITRPRPLRNLFRGIAFFLILSDLYGLLAYASRMLGLPFFDMRLMLLIWIMILFIGLVVLLVLLPTKYRKQMRDFYEEEERRKYMPKRNL